MKKILSILLVLCLIFALSACGGRTPKTIENKSNVENKKVDDVVKYNIVVTTFPIYDWVKSIVGDDVSFNIKLLQDNGADLHNYQPSVEDIVAITESDLFIYIGGESDDWVEDLEAQNKINSLNLMELLSEDYLLEEVEKEGMTVKESDEEDEEEEEIDEHIWLSLKNAQVLCKGIEDAIIEIAEDKRDIIENNAVFYINTLLDLDKKYTEMLSSYAGSVLVVGDRFPFAYLFKDLGLDYYAAFKGCSAETEASFETIVFLAEQVDKNHLSSIIVLEGKDHRIADTIIENTASKNQEIVSLNSMQNITAKDIKDGVHYVDIMKSNMEALQGIFEK